MAMKTIYEICSKIRPHKLLKMIKTAPQISFLKINFINGITLGLAQSDTINQMIKISKLTGHLQ